MNVDCAASGSGSYDGSGWLVADTSASVGASGVAGWWVAGLESPQQVATSWVLDSGRQQPCSAEPAVGCGHGHSAGSAPSVARARTAASARLERVPITLNETPDPAWKSTGQGHVARMVQDLTP